MEDQPDRRTRVRRSRAEIDELLAAFRRSGKTQQAFCHDQGLSVATFSNWRRKAEASGCSSPALRPVRLLESSQWASVTVRFPEGLEVSFSPGADAGQVASVAAALKSGLQC